MLHLEIQKDKEAIKTSKFQKYIGSTTTFTRRLAISTKGCGQLKSNYTYFADRYFSFVKTSEEAMAAGVDYCRLTKITHKGFCLATLENLMKDWAGGSYLVMDINTKFTGCRPLLAIGYKYNSSKVL